LERLVAPQEVPSWGAVEALVPEQRLVVRQVPLRPQGEVVIDKRIAAGRGRARWKKPKG